MRFFPLLALALMLLTPSLASAGAAQELTVPQVAELLKSNPKLAIFDANVPRVRKMFGSIPQAVLLGSHNAYRPDKVRPKNKAEKLGFYCANTRCGASLTAAKRALDSGYKDVGFMPDGIMGWRKAKLPTKKLK
jgi:rhodanese-related sulfurtransferase